MDDLSVWRRPRNVVGFSVSLLVGAALLPIGSAAGTADPNSAHFEHLRVGETVTVFSGLGLGAKCLASGADRSASLNAGDRLKVVGRAPHDWGASHEMFWSVVTADGKRLCLRDSEVDEGVVDRDHTFRVNDHLVNRGPRIPVTNCRARQWITTNDEMVRTGDHVTVTHVNIGEVDVVTSDGRTACATASHLSRSG